MGSLANGGTCLVVGWSGDIIRARDRAEEASNGVHVAYSIPKEGAPQWFDMLAIPKDAKHPEAAYRFINYLLEPKVAAANTNFIHYANPIPTATPLVDEAIRTDPTIYPPADVAEDVHLLDQHAGDRQALHPAVDRGEDRPLSRSGAVGPCPAAPLTCAEAGTPASAKVLQDGRQQVACVAAAVAQERRTHPLQVVHADEEQPRLRGNTEVAKRIAVCIQHALHVERGHSATKPVASTTARIPAAFRSSLHGDGSGSQCR